MVCVIFVYAAAMALWTVIVAVGRRRRSFIGIATLAVLLPIVFIGMEMVMAFSVMAADEVHGIVLYTPTLLMVLYFLLSVGLVVRAHRAPQALPKREQRGFPVEAVHRVIPADAAEQENPGL